MIKPISKNIIEQPQIKVLKYDNEFECLFECIMNYTDTKACNYNVSNSVCTIYTNANYLIVKNKNFDPKTRKYFI